MSRKGSDGPKQKVLSFQEVGQKRKMVVKIELVYLPLSYSPDRNIFKKGFKNTGLA